MEENHLSLETLAKWLAGRLEHDAVLQQIVPHLIATCPVCRERYEQIRQLKREAGHEDEEVGVVEWQEAPELLRRLEQLPLTERHLRVEEDESLHTWGLCQLLLQRSREAVSEDPGLALSRAELALSVSRHLGDAYDPGWVLDLRARAYAALGNALRVLSELCAAEAAFREAESCLSHSGTGNSWAKAEVLDLKSSLRQDQRRFEEGEELLDDALALYRKAGDSHGIGKIHLQRAKLYREMGDLERSIELLRKSRDEIDAGQGALAFCLCEVQPAVCSHPGRPSRGSLEPASGGPGPLPPRQAAGPRPSALGGGGHRRGPGPVGRGGGRVPGGAGGVREAPDALQRGAGRARSRAAAGASGPHGGAEAPLGRAGERLRVAGDPPRGDRCLPPLPARLR